MATPFSQIVQYVTTPLVSVETKIGQEPRPLPLLAWLLAVALFAPVLDWLVQIWTTSIYDAHGVLVPFLAMGMIFGARGALSAAPRETENAGLGLTGAGLALLLTALLMNFKLLGGVALVLVIAGMVWTLWGRTVLRLVAFPLAFLLLMLPLNYPLEIFIGFPLRLVSTKLSAMLLGLLGLNVTVSGTVITTSNFSVAIESPCSGLKTLSALLMTGLVLSYFLHKRWWHRALIALLILPTAVFANALRNTVITMIGHHYGEDAAMGWLHAFSGLAVFLLAMAMLILISETLLWRKKSTST
ncbi:MAG: exosortase/archaeosortase family protein [bacterium]